MLRRIGVLTLIILAVLCVIKYYGNSQVEAQAGQISHVRIAGCTVSSSSPACSVTGNWSPAFLDTKYTAACNAVNIDTTAYTFIKSKTATQVTVTMHGDTFNTAGNVITATAQSFDCIAVHD